ncbi:MAG: SRPBCC family protein [Gemmatimonadota bacterium]
MIRIVVTVVVVLLVALGVVLFMGYRLPVGHIVARSAPVAASPDAVFALLIDMEHHPAWRDGVTSTERLPSVEGRTRFRETSGSDALTLEILDARAPVRLVTRIVGEKLPFGGQWVFDVEPATSGSRLTITEHGEVYSPLFRFVSHYIMGQTTTIDRYLGSVVRHFGGDGTIADANPAARPVP